jgi:hypothetical protein
MACDYWAIITSLKQEVMVKSIFIVNLREVKGLLHQARDFPNGLPSGFIQEKLEEGYPGVPPRQYR